MTQPLKIFKAGCQCFLESLEVQDKEYVDYYHAALSTQYLIEDTISSIELINEYDESTPIIMICDTNAFDLKYMNPDYMWLHYLKQQKVLPLPFRSMNKPSRNTTVSWCMSSRMTPFSRKKKPSRRTGKASRGTTKWKHPRRQGKKMLRGS